MCYKAPEKEFGDRTCHPDEVPVHGKENSDSTAYIGDSTDPALACNTETTVEKSKGINIPTVVGNYEPSSHAGEVSEDIVHKT